MLKVKFTIRKNGSRVSNGILVYNHDYGRSRQATPDILDRAGFAETSWSDNWDGAYVEVFCHTDGINQGVPAYVGRVKIERYANYELNVQRNGPTWRDM